MVVNERKWTLILLALICVFVITSAKIYNSCRELKNAGQNRNGLYRIKTNIGNLQVFCEMKIGGGGFTYLPNYALERGNLNLRKIFTDRFNVLLRIRKKSGPQTYTLIQPYIYEPMSVKINSYAGYTKPVNTHLGNYIFLGILPARLARTRNTQGFKSNGKPVTFRNCDANPNSLFAFFPNYHHYAPSNYHSKNLVYERSGVAVNWRNTGKRANDRLPHGFFFLTECHFGGCGTYTSSNRWTDATGTAIGLR